MVGNSAVGYDLFLSSSNNVISSSKISSSLIAGNQAEGVLISENSDNNTVRSSQVLNDSLNGVDVYPGVTGPASSPTRSTATAAGSSCGPEPPGAPSRATPRRTTPTSTWRTTTAPPVTRTSGCTTTSIPPTSHASTEICTASARDFGRPLGGEELRLADRARAASIPVALRGTLKPVACWPLHA